MKEQTVTITSVEPEFNMQEMNRGLKFLVIAVAEDGEQLVLKYDIVNVGAELDSFDLNLHKWWHPSVSDSFCQLCDLMSLLKCESLAEMVGKKLVIRTHKNNTVISNSDGKQWIGYLEGIETGLYAGNISGILMTEEWQVQHYLYQ